MDRPCSAWVRIRVRFIIILSKQLLTRTPFRRLRVLTQATLYTVLRDMFVSAGRNQVIDPLIPLQAQYLGAELAATN